MPCQAIAKSLRSNLPRRDEGHFFQMVDRKGLAFRNPDKAYVGHFLALLFKRRKDFFCGT
jgi:hypothetical protein